MPDERKIRDTRDKMAANIAKQSGGKISYTEAQKRVQKSVKRVTRDK